METLTLIQALTEAHAILKSAQRSLASGPTAIWRKASHATDYLDAQIAAFLAPENN
jgi:hypothetical protein